jgi:hypothetical protein
MATDAFGRLRVAENFTTFNYYPTPLTSASNLDEDVWVTSGNSQSYNSSNYIEMSLSGAPSNYCLRQTKCPMVYQAGKSRLIYMTGVMMTTLVSAVSCMGLFNITTGTPPTINAGMYFKTDGTNLIWEEVTQTGTNTVNQASWNIDTFDGSGPSGQTLTITNATQDLLIVFDQEWLGVGRIRCGFIIDGVTYYAHEFTHDGMTVPYTNTPRLRLSYLIYGSNVSTTMRQMCCTCCMESGYYTIGKHNSIGCGGGFVTTSQNTKNILLALRANPSYVNATFTPHSVTVQSNGGSSNIFYFEAQMVSTNGSVGTITGTPPSWTSLKDSAIQFYIGTGNSLYVGTAGGSGTTPPTYNSSTDGYILTSGYTDSKTSQSFVVSVEQSLLTRLSFTQYDTLIIVGYGTANTTAGASVDFTEEL